MLFGIGAGFSGMWNAEKAADELGMEVAPALLVTHYYDVWFVINICNLSATFSHLLAICTCISALFSPVCVCVCVCVEGGLDRGVASVWAFCNGDSNSCLQYVFFARCVLQSCTYRVPLFEFGNLIFRWIKLGKMLSKKLIMILVVLLLKKTSLKNALSKRFQKTFIKIF